MEIAEINAIVVRNQEKIVGVTRARRGTDSCHDLSVRGNQRKKLAIGRRTDGNSQAYKKSEQNRSSAWESSHIPLPVFRWPEPDVQKLVPADKDDNDGRIHFFLEFASE